jgi:hypothetical protein
MVFLDKARMMDNVQKHNIVPVNFFAFVRYWRRKWKYNETVH